MPGLTKYVERYSQEEQRILSPFFSNVDRNVFVLRNTLPEGTKAALVAKYSRSPKTMRRLFLDEFVRESSKDPFPPELLERIDLLERLEKLGEIGGARSTKFFATVLAQYGDDSVIDSASATIAIEGVEQLTTKEVENGRLGGYIEKSTRYLDFTRPVKIDAEGFVLGYSDNISGHYLYREYPALQTSNVGTLYSETMDTLFRTVKELQGPVAKVLRESIPLDDQEFTITVDGKPVVKKFSKISTLQGIDVYKEEEKARKAYESSIKAKTFDLTRGPLPASTLTNFGWHAAFRSLDHTLRKMLSSDYPPALTTADACIDELTKESGALITGVRDKHGLDEIALMKKQRADLKALTRKIEPGLPALGPAVEKESTVRLISNGEGAAMNDMIAAATLYPYSTRSVSDLMIGSDRHSQIVLATALDGRTNRRHKPPRSFETALITQEFVGNFGIYRDLERNRFTLHIRQDLSTGNGYDMPDAVVKAGTESKFRDAMEASDTLYRTMLEQMPEYAQLATTFAHRLRWLAVYNVRQAVHFHALRTIPEGHPDYRKLMQKAGKNIAQKYGDFGGIFKFVNWDEHQLERLAAAHRTEKKLEELQRTSG